MSSGKGFEKEVVTTEIVHHRIHQGFLFTKSAINLDLITNGFVRVLVRVVTGAAHMTFTGAVSANMVARLYEAPTLTNDGTAMDLTKSNRNRFKSNTPLTLLFADPVVADPGGEPLTEQLMPGGSGGNAGGGDGSAFEEWVLKSGDYLVELENVDGPNALASMQIIWYEPPEGVPRI